jgi:hypothetical protein
VRLSYSVPSLKQPDLAHLNIDVTIEDPGTLTKPLERHMTWELAPGGRKTEIPSLTGRYSFVKVSPTPRTEKIPIASGVRAHGRQSPKPRGLQPFDFSFVQVNQRNHLSIALLATSVLL